MYHLKVINSVDDPWTVLIKDDPVRPEISLHDRVGDFSEIILLINEQDEPAAVVCVRYCNSVPSTVDELINDPGNNFVAVFYSIWSYIPGSGRKMIEKATMHIMDTRPNVKRFVTLSPRTEMAERFHLKNGAKILRENSTTVNFEYHA